MKILMKKLLCMALLLVYDAFLMHGRDYEPMLVQGRSWFYDGTKADGKNEFGFTILVDCIDRYDVAGDSIVDGVAFKLVKYFKDDVFKRSYLVKEDCAKGKIECLNPFDNQSLWPIYDFSLTPGGQTNILFDGAIDGETLAVLTEDAVDAGGKTWRRLKVESPFCGVQYWIEGIGSIDARSQLTVFMHTGPYEYPAFRECRQDGEIIFTKDDFNAETSAVRSIATADIGVSATYDIMGRRVDKLQPGGLYICNGQKFIAR